MTNSASEEGEVVISVKALSKSFKLPHEKTSSLKQAITGFRKRKKTFEVQKTLQNVSLEVKKGEFLGIVGRNGSGKSTLLKILAGIYVPTEGSVETRGKVVPFIELGVGFNGELSGRENVFLNGALLGYGEEDVAKKYDEIVEFAELEKFMDQKLKNYSSGMQVRLAFSVATALAASDILIIDEVLAVGDASFQRKCFEYFTELKANKKTVVFVSHDMEAVKEYCDRAVLIQDGKIKVEGRPEAVAKEYFKLFNDQKGSKKSTKTRWGSGVATIRKATADITEETITVTAEVATSKSITRPIVGFNLRPANSETRIFGTNTKIERIDTGVLSAGQSISVSFTFPNVFSESQYKVDIAVLDRNAIDTYDWWESALTLSVERDKRLPFPLQLEIQTNVKTGR